MDIEATVFLSPLIQGMIMSTGFAALVDCRGWCEHMFILERHAQTLYLKSYFLVDVDLSSYIY